MISSVGNSRIKNVITLKNKAKARKEQHCFLVEGLRSCQEIPDALLAEGFISHSCRLQFQDALPQWAEAYEVVTDEVFQKMSDTVTPQGILAVVKQHQRTFEDVIASGLRQGSGTFLILEDLQDPGNLGTIVRTAEAAGVDGIVMSRDTVDIYNPKVVRSTMGSIFRVPFLYVPDIIQSVKQMKDYGIQICGAYLSGSVDYDLPDYTGSVAFMIGNEGRGLSDAVAAEADQLISIPMCGTVESLNAACAATVLMYEAYRQKRRNKVTIL